ncbi:MULTISPECIES: antitoxin MazE family protein [unclassified Rhizobium]|uniref:antitoxin MazE family protein n=1 Tax=unclassified Rhizobium TaxID=2613769 RepID=UPI00180302B2|nr:antitoxin MazE family protein [Rhizobium sp. UBA1881]
MSVVRKGREAPKVAGMRPIRIWVPDTRQPGFVEECRRQSLLIAQADETDSDLSPFMDDALADLDHK